MVEKKRSVYVVAVVDIGSNAIRMDIAEIKESGNFKILESLMQPIRLGIDAFSRGKLSKESVKVACKALEDFKRAMDTYKVDYQRMIATSAVREALNNESFINRAMMTTGIDMDVISDAEELKLNYLATMHTIKNHPDFSDKDCMIVDLGAGGTEVTFLTKGNISTSKNYRLGTLRMLQSIKRYKGKKHAHLILQSKVKNTVDLVTKAVHQKKLDFFIARGADIKKIAKIKNWKLNGSIFIIPKVKFLEACDTMMTFAVDKLVQKFELNYNEAETIYPASITFKNFAETFVFDNVLIPMTSMRQGIILDLINHVFHEGIDTDFSKQVINSAKELGMRYQMDDSHSLHVAKLSLAIFDKLKNMHGLKGHDRFLLEIAAILHDIGSFVNEGQHHLHSYYLVSNSDLIGLSKADVDIIANLVRYHRIATPSLSDTNFFLLDRPTRIKVNKLAAILRVADALDRSHSQVINNFILKIRGDKLFINPTTSGVYEYEKLAIEQKSNLFESVYGYNVFLQ